MTRGNIADYLLNSRICAAVNDWLLDRWLSPMPRAIPGTIRVNPEDVRGAVAEIERLADHPKMVQIGVPMQSREPYGKPMFEPIWEAAAAHGLPSPSHQRRQRRRYAPTFAGHAYTYPGYAAFMPLNSFVHLATLIIDGMFGGHPDLGFVFADGGYDMLTPLMWRLDTSGCRCGTKPLGSTAIRASTCRTTVRFCSSALDGPTDEARRSDGSIHRQGGSAHVRVELPALVHLRPGRRGRGPKRRATRKGAVANASELYGVGPRSEGSLA